LTILLFRLKMLNLVVRQGMYVYAWPLVSNKSNTSSLTS
jgi:hypothetical protein